MPERGLPDEDEGAPADDGGEELEVIDAPAPAEDSSLPEDPELDPEGRPREP